MPFGSSRRRVVGTAVAAGVVLLGAGVWVLHPVLAVGAAYKAKALCSATFVSKRSFDTAIGELHVDDLARLRHISASLDERDRSVTASAFGLLTRRAVFRPGLGCALALDGLSPPRLPPESTDPRPAAPPPDKLERIDPMPAVDRAIARAFTEIDPDRPRRTQAVVVLQNGRIVGEQYARSFGPATPLPGWSMAKSVVNAMAGILVGQGRIQLDQPIPIAEFHGDGDRRASIRLDDLLRMSSGLEFDEGMSSPRSDVMRMLLRSGDAAAVAIPRKVIAKPGVTWSYSSGSTNIISRAIRNVIANDAAYLTFPRRELFDRIGMTSATLETDASGTFVGSSFMYATARDWARFGQFYLQDGVWNGVRVLPDGWVSYSTTPAPADPAKRYGAHFWLQVPDEYGSDLPMPLGIFHAVGHEGQFVSIVPSRDVVIVRLGRTRYPKVWDQVGFVRDVLVALDQVSR